MNTVLEDIIDEIDRKSECLRIDFGDDSWRRTIPSEAGWYVIKTDTPLAVLMSVGLPQHKAHINIPQTIRTTASLQELGIAITQSTGGDYAVYNGEAENLKARAREHECGHAKTYCLGLSDYEKLKRYKWTFCYVPISKCKGSLKIDKVCRLAVEQGWRTKHGWPILCRK